MGKRGVERIRDSSCLGEGAVSGLEIIDGDCAPGRKKDWIRRGP